MYCQYILTTVKKVKIASKIGLSEVSLRTANISVNCLKGDILKHCKAVMSMENSPYLPSVHIPTFVEGCKLSINTSLYTSVPSRFKTQKIFDEAVRIEQYLLKFVLDYFNKQETCDEAMCFKLASFFLISNRLETQDICTKAAEEDPWDLSHVSDHFKAQEMCEEAVSEDSYSLQYFSDWFLTLQEMWYEYFENNMSLLHRAMGINYARHGKSRYIKTYYL